MKYLYLTLIAFSSHCLAQSTPAEFSEMSFQELFNQNIYELDTKKKGNLAMVINLSIQNRGVWRLS